MSLPEEKRKALLYAKEFLRRLLNPKETPSVPTYIRREAYWRLKHYPMEYEIKDFKMSGEK